MRRRYKERALTAAELAAACAQPLLVVTKAGALRNGAERGHGATWHLAPGKDHWNAGRALCGAAPAIQWTTWGTPKATCSRCLRKAEGEMTRLGAIGLIDRSDDIRLTLRANRS
jgi:hypothetical protein